MIPYSRQSVSNADVRAVEKVLRSPRITQGPAVDSFEQALAKKTQMKFCVAFNSGTAALHAAYAAAGVVEGDEVIVPALTFAATSNAALYLGARPVFADIDPEYFTIDVEDASKKITPRTKAIVPVDYGGRIADMRALRSLARKHKLVLIADAAHSLGAKYYDAPAGSLADMTMLSFHPVKSITTAEGGAIVTNNKKYYERLRMFRTHGLTKDPKRLVSKKEGPWHQEMQLLGYNYRITDVLAALGESQLKRLDTFVAKRRAAARRYQVLLKDVKGISLPAPERAYERSAWHLYPIRVDSRKRKQIFNALTAAGIGVQVHYIPVYLHPFYSKLGYKKGLCPQAEKFYQSEISIPLFPGITLSEQQKVARALTRACVTR